MHLRVDTYEHIKITAINTLEYYDIKCVPISAFEMANKIGLSVIPYSAFCEKAELLMKQSEDGFIVGKSIYYNDKCKNYGRINQTIMHEIGHYILGHKSNGEEEESEAKFFAKYTLAPPPLIHKMLDNPTIEDIADLFDISYTAASNALNYYQKWRYYGGLDFTPYEQKLLRLFNVA